MGQVFLTTCKYLKKTQLEGGRARGGGYFNTHELAKTTFSFQKVVCGILTWRGAWPPSSPWTFTAFSINHNIYIIYTVYPRSLGPIYIVTYYIKWFKTYWTGSNYLSWVYRGCGDGGITILTGVGGISISGHLCNILYTPLNNIYIVPCMVL